MNSNRKVNGDIEVYRKTSKSRESVIKLSRDFISSINKMDIIDYIFAVYLNSNILFLDFIENNLDLRLGSEILYYYDDINPSFIVLKYYDFENFDLVMFCFNGHNNKIRISIYESYWQKIDKELLFQIFPECVWFIDQIDTESLK